MKNFLVLILLFSFTQLRAQAPDPDFTEKMARSEGANYLKMATFKELDGYADWDLIYQKLDFTVDPAVRKITGSVYSLATFRKDGLAKIALDLT
jgi:hypothetical protein